MVHVGDLTLGAESPIRLQSMTNTSTMDSEACVKQAQTMVDAGCEIVRLTTQGVREAENLNIIHQQLFSQGCRVPLVADVHFNPKAAERAARHVEKVRINPGNFADPMTIPDSIGPQEYGNYVQSKIRERFVPFLDICKEHHTAIRIGVNHGSLSSRIADRYGDTPEGMVASCMEYLRICQEEHFSDVVISIKASNTLIMVQTVRLLVATMDAAGMSFPIHLGVTEAGDGEDGRIKSAVGIGALLTDGIGDTIRVSLSEAPENEIPVARYLRDYVSARQEHPAIQAQQNHDFDFYHFHRRETRKVDIFGGGQMPAVIGENTKEWIQDDCQKPDFVYRGQRIYRTDLSDSIPIYDVRSLDGLDHDASPVKFLRITYPQLDRPLLNFLKARENLVLLLESGHLNAPAEMRAFFHTLLNEECHIPVVLCRTYQNLNVWQLPIAAAADLGGLLLDGFGDGIMIRNLSEESQVSAIQTSFGILQATRQRISKTEYISCPGCGRTLYDLQQTLAKIKEATKHLKGLKIAVMGCIVNGPGEMADADYGYVGAGRGRISLYKGRQCIEKNIPQEEAVGHLISFIEKDRNQS